MTQTQTLQTQRDDSDCDLTSTDVDCDESNRRQNTNEMTPIVTSTDMCDDFSRHYKTQRKHLIDDL